MMNKLAHFTDEEVKELQKVVYSIGIQTGYGLARKEAIKLLKNVIPVLGLLGEGRATVKEVMEEIKKYLDVTHCPPHEMERARRLGKDHMPLRRNTEKKNGKTQ
ncbi:MAG TPA: hypothetical protein VLH56_15215 [Dissulfurispiraceae bacterium]|nr:hypothetical protein [Dissulfurispiraceae bacterium]